MKLVIKCVILFCLPLALLACGSGGEDAAFAAYKTRALQTGDSWIYDVVGQGHSNTETYTYSGTSIISITKDTINPEILALSANEETISSTGSHGNSSAALYVQQDPGSCDIRLYGVEYPGIAAKTVTDGPLPVIWPGRWETGKTIAADIHYDDGTSDSSTYSYTVFEKEFVTTPAGTFAAWKYVVELGTLKRTFWYSPQLGNYVKIEMTFGPDSNTYTLRSTNVPH